MAAFRISTPWDARAFDLHASDPTSWYDAAQANRRAAKILADTVTTDWEAMEHYIRTLAAASAEERQPVKATEPDEPKLDGGALFMYALALENLLKGIIVARQPVKGGTLSKSLTRHDLVRLASAASVALDSNDKSVLGFIARCGMSWGRYPVALSADKMEGSFAYDWLQLVQYLDAFYDRLSELLVQACRARGPGS